MKALFLLLRFLLELAAIAALLFAGAAIAGGAAGWLLGSVAAAAAVVLWGLFVAPRARIKAPTLIRLAVEVAVFAAATVFLLLAGWIVAAVILAVLYVADRVALAALGAPVFESPEGVVGGY